MVSNSDIQAAIEKLDAMSDRCDALIKKELAPIRPDRSYPAVPKPAVRAEVLSPPAPRPVVASGELTGNEMRMPTTKKVKASSRSGYVHYECDCDSPTDPEGIWAHFEQEFDDMVAGLR